MPGFQQRDVLLLQELLQLALPGTSIGDVFNRKKNSAMKITIRAEQRVCIQQHDAPARPVKLLLDFECFQGDVISRGVRQKRLELWDIPLPIPQNMDRTSLNVLTFRPKRRVKAAVRGYNAEVLIEDQERFAGRIDDRLCERAHITKFDERPIVDQSQWRRWKCAVTSSAFPRLCSHSWRNH